MTAKYWGRGPERWNADMIFFKTMGPPDPQPGSHAAGNVPAGPVMSPAGGDTRAQYRLIPSPTQLCRWSRHTNQWEFESLPSSDPNNYDANDDTTWPAWPEDRDRLTLQEAMATTLGTHDFTSISRHELPMSAEAIAKAAQRSPEQLGIEAFAFAIMSGNMERIRGIFEENGGRAPQQSHKIFPFHLAASFMDASRNCCLVLSELIERLDEHQSIDLKFEDASGHTVLDMLMVNILRSHTTVTPEQISEAFLGQKRFPGEERDICGRWDADSPCIRRLLALGEPRVPAHWKHAFCHTSVLGICHGITALFGLPWAPDINTISSGLFSRSCPACHRHLTLKPLHCLVLVAFHLAQNGRPGETLFGPLACLTALLVHGADPCLRADISVRPLVNFRNSNSNSGGGGGGGSDDQDACDHSLLTAAALSWKVAPPSVVRGWAEETQLGWRVFVKTLKHVTYDDGHCASQIQEIAGEDGDSGMSGSSYNARSRDLIPHDNNSNRHSRPSRQASGSSNLVVGTIWDTVQAEFLKHRRVSEHDPWMSPNFSMGAIEDWLDGRMGRPERPLLGWRTLGGVGDMATQSWGLLVLLIWGGGGKGRGGASIAGAIILYTGYRQSHRHGELRCIFWLGRRGSWHIAYCSIKKRWLWHEFWRL